MGIMNFEAKPERDEEEICEACEVPKAHVSSNGHVTWRWTISMMFNGN